AAAGTGGWNGGAGFKPIGDGVTGFSGSLDGAGHVVSGLVINRPGADSVGLVGVLTGASSGPAKIANIGLSGGSITGNRNLGALVGVSDTGT
ncbi:hypothetical protein, partial [Escherichia coli]|uniref:hypothetical protein n=1 Tax=Escherichia coli TaxID=562 RepID=UPI0013D78ECC